MGSDVCVREFNFHGRGDLQPELSLGSLQLNPHWARKSDDQL